MYTRQQKSIVSVLIFFACITLILGFAQMQKTLRAPLLFNEDSTKKVASTGDISSLFQVDGTKDTDGDGLLDNDELTRYGTSPYLADSDSDGKSDRLEIEAGADPNCPTGKQCAAVALGSNTSTGGVATPRTLNDLLTQQSSIIMDVGGSSPVNKEPSAQELRQALRASGVSDTQLDAIDDATLLQFYSETAIDLKKTETKDTAKGSVSAPAQGTTPQKMSATEIRAILKTQGVTDAELAQVDDTALEQMFLETMKAQLQKSKTQE